jgi:hypothetical protein
VVLPLSRRGGGRREGGKKGRREDEEENGQEGRRRRRPQIHSSGFLLSHLLWPHKQVWRAEQRIFV